MRGNKQSLWPIGPRDDSAIKTKGKRSFMHTLAGKAFNTDMDYERFNGRERVGIQYRDNNVPPFLGLPATRFENRNSHLERSHKGPLEH